MSGYASKAEATAVISATLDKPPYTGHKDYFVNRIVAELVSGSASYGWSIDISAENFLASAKAHRRAKAGPNPFDANPPTNEPEPRPYEYGMTYMTSLISSMQ